MRDSIDCVSRQFSREPPIAAGRMAIVNIKHSSSRGRPNNLISPDSGRLV